MAILSANSRRNLSAGSSPTKTEFGDELFADVTGNAHGFKPIQPIVIVEDRTCDDYQPEEIGKPEEIVEEETLIEETEKPLSSSEEPGEPESRLIPEESLSTENYSDDLRIEENCPTVTELETTEISEENEPEDSPPLIQEIDDFLQIEANKQSINSATEVCIEELSNETCAETEIAADLETSTTESSHFDEKKRKLSFSSFINWEITDSGMIEVSQSPEPDESLRIEESEESTDCEAKGEEKEKEKETEIPVVCDEKITDYEPKDEAKEEKEDSVVCNESIPDDRESIDSQEVVEKTPVVTKAWCKNNNPVLVDDEEDEDARLVGRLRTRHIVCTGSVSRTAKMFEKEEEANSLSQKQPNPASRIAPVAPEPRPQNERIRKAFAFWNK